MSWCQMSWCWAEGHYADGHDTDGYDAGGHNAECPNTQVFTQQEPFLFCLIVKRKFDLIFHPAKNKSGKLILLPKLS